MSRLLLRPQGPVASSLNFTKRWMSSLGFWGATTGVAGLLFLSVTPLVRREVLQKTPFLSSYYEDKTPASDKPF